jgi:hypothetical protein
VVDADHGRGRLDFLSELVIAMDNDDFEAGLQARIASRDLEFKIDPQLSPLDRFLASCGVDIAASDRLIEQAEWDRRALEERRVREREEAQKSTRYTAPQHEIVELPRFLRTVYGSNDIGREEHEHRFPGACRR